MGSNQETECIGGVCTTTTRFVDGHGNEVGSKSEEQPRDDYCAKNPSSQQCKQSSFGGACQGGFTCEGDAVQCALAREVYQRNCQWFKDPSPEMKAAGDAAVAGGAQPEGHPGKSGQEVEISLAGQLDQLDRLGGGCPTDVSLSVVGHQVVLPFSQMCSSLNMVGQIAVAICLIWAAIIVFKE
ncbi:hypothetical protein CDN99_25645 [Roseateles aquatilis]|uniref:Uncharacterized protein n=2 Tax=Roseateles aquatilis TaxID=431061 RepID=A0A246IUF6_9BURK|nr:hypothetical protein CDN99_25645 [Roseateles aquatilis]